MVYDQTDAENPNQRPSDSDTEEFEDSGTTGAILVRVPAAHTVRDILSWHLGRFREFPIIKAEFSWDSLEFRREDNGDTIEDYREILGKASTHWWESAIWTPKAGGERLVNFTPATYDIFVLGGIDPERVPWRFYDLLFDNRASRLPQTKRLAYERIRDSGRPNLWEYEGNVQRPLAAPDEFERCSERIGNCPGLNSAYEYELRPAPAGLTSARLAHLVREFLAADLKEVYPKAKHISHDASRAKFQVRFVPYRMISLPTDLVLGCIVCREAREPGLYVCIDHVDCDTPLNRSEAERRIGAAAGDLVKVMESIEVELANVPPATLSARFREKGIQYDLTLRRCGEASKQV